MSMEKRRKLHLEHQSDHQTNEMISQAAAKRGVVVVDSQIFLADEVTMALKVVPVLCLQSDVDCTRTRFKRLFQIAGGPRPVP